MRFKSACGLRRQVDAGCILARSTNDSLQVNRTTEPSEIGAAHPSGGSEILGGTLSEIPTGGSRMHYDSCANDFLVPRLHQPICLTRAMADTDPLRQ